MTARKRKVVATEETQTVTFSRRRRALAIEEDTRELPALADYPLLRTAPGWDSVPQLNGPGVRAQREEQVRRSAMAVVAQVLEGDPRDNSFVAQTAANLLRAGPGASMTERVFGRYA